MRNSERYFSEKCHAKDWCDIPGADMIIEKHGSETNRLNNSSGGCSRHDWTLFMTNWLFYGCKK